MLSPQQIDAYERDGYLSGLWALGPDELRRARDGFDALEAREGRETAQIGFIDRHFNERFIWDVATHPPVLDAIEAILGPDILLLATHFFCKYGPNERFVAWHQDLRYWNLEPLIEATAWVAIDDSDSRNGCMRVIPGRPAGELREHGKSRQDGNLLSINQEVAVSAEDEAAAVDCVLKAGEMSIHDGMLIHGSLPNRSARRRCGLTLRYVPPSVRPLATGSTGTGGTWRPILVRGSDTHGNFAKEPPPFPLPGESTTATT